MLEDDYKTEIAQLAEDIVDEIVAENADVDDELGIMDLASERIHEIVDGHEWIIYTRHHRDVYDHTTNPEAYQDVYDNHEIGRIVANDGVEHLEMIMAFFGMLYDVTDMVAIVAKQRIADQVGIEDWDSIDLADYRGHDYGND